MAVETLLSFNQSVNTIETGLLLQYGQTVGNIEAGALLSFEQNVALRNTESGTLLSFLQAVQHSETSTLLSFSQSVRNSVLPAPEFDFELNIGNFVIPHNQLCGELTITREEESAALLSVTLKPIIGVQDLTYYQGKPITLDVIKSNGSVHRIYTGRVDIPEIDLLGERIALRCSNNRKELLNELDPTFVGSIGAFSEAVYGEPEDQADEVEKRLETVEASLDFTPLLIPIITSWQPKDTPDFILDDAGIYRRKPSVEVAARGRIVNKVDINLEYQYQRLRHRERDFEFDSGLSACYYSAWGLPPKVQMLRAAIEGAGWHYTNLQTVGVDPAGKYNCSGSTLYWTPISRTADYRESKDSDGNVITDPNGNPIIESYNETQTDVTNVYANSASWKAAQRFTQNVSEKITVTIESPQSIAQYGEVSKNYRFGVESVYENEDEFTDIESYLPPPSDFTQSENGDWVLNADNEGDSDQQWRDMVQCAARKAIAEIRKSHRSNKVVLQVPFWPEVDLRHTIETTAGRIKCKGKVSRIEHYIDLRDRFHYTQIELSLSRVEGTAPADGVLTVVRPTVTDKAEIIQTIKLKTHDIPINGEQDPDWNGYIFQVLANPGLTPYGLKTPVAMIVDTPDIDEESRDTKEVNAEQTEQIDIRNDPLTVEFYG